MKVVVVEVVVVVVAVQPVAAGCMVGHAACPPAQALRHMAVKADPE